MDTDVGDLVTPTSDQTMHIRRAAVGARESDTRTGGACEEPSATARVPATFPRRKEESDSLFRSGKGRFFLPHLDMSVFPLFACFPVFER